VSAITDPSARIQIKIPRPAAPAAEPRSPEAESVKSNASDDLSVVPPMPESLDDTGIPLAVIEQLVLKLLYFRGDVLGRDLASLMGLQYSLIDELLETLKRQHHVGVKKSLGMGNSSGVFALTESGRNLTREYLESNQYAGPVPVPLYQYAEVVRRQRLAENWLSPQSLQRANAKKTILFLRIDYEQVFDVLAEPVSRGQFARQRARPCSVYKTRMATGKRRGVVIFLQRPLVSDAAAHTGNERFNFFMADKKCHRGLLGRPETAGQVMSYRHFSHKRAYVV